MGQKVSPTGLRIGINKDWESKWYAENDFAKYLNNDYKIRKFLNKKFKNASISQIIVERNAKRTEIFVHAAKPGLIIGQSGVEIEKIKKENDIQTYKEIVSFSEGKRLDEIHKQREIGKRPYQKLLLMLGSGVVAVLVCMLMSFLMNLI